MSARSSTVLRRHVGRRARLHAARRQDRRFERRNPRCDRRRHPRRVGDAEVEHLHNAVDREVDVARLQIAMDDALGVRRAERRCELAPDRDDAIDRQPLALHARRQALAFDVLHDDEGAVVVLDDVVDGRDIRMRDARGRAGFVKDAEASLAAARERSDDALQRHLPAQPRVAAEEHVAHAAAADRIDDDVGADARARLELVVVDGLLAGRRIGQEVGAVAVGREERDDFAGQLVVGAAIADELLPFRRGALERLADDVLRLFPGRRFHGQCLLRWRGLDSTAPGRRAARSSRSARPMDSRTLPGLPMFSTAASI